VTWDITSSTARTSTLATLLLCTLTNERQLQSATSKYSYVVEKYLHLSVNGVFQMDIDTLKQVDIFGSVRVPKRYDGCS